MAKRFMDNDVSVISMFLKINLRMQHAVIFDATKVNIAQLCSISNSKRKLLLKFQGDLSTNMCEMFSMYPWVYLKKWACV